MIFGLLPCPGSHHPRFATSNSKLTLFHRRFTIKLFGLIMAYLGGRGQVWDLIPMAIKDLAR